MMSTRVADFRLQDWLPLWLGVDDLIAALAALAVLVALIGVYNALRSHNPFERRFAQIAQRKESLRRAVLDSGRGFLLFRGFPSDRLDPASAELAYVGFGLQFGHPVGQDAQANLLGHVRDEGDGIVVARSRSRPATKQDPAPAASCIFHQFGHLSELPLILQWPKPRLLIQAVAHRHGSAIVD